MITLRCICSCCGVSHAFIHVTGLGLLEQLHKGVLDRLLWCMRFDRSEVLRAEACQAVQNLGLQSQRIIEELQSLVSLDDSELVVR